MKISLITPANKQSLSGNRTTAVRWARILRDLGHRVDIALDYDGAPADAMVALHAWRSASSIARFHDLHPDRPLIVALTGTDIYRFIESHKSVTLRSIALADRLVALHDLAGAAIPAKYRAKLHIIYQSALPLPRARTPVRRYFDVCVIGHLRDEKDSMRTAYAARLLPKSSKIRVSHLGRAHDESWAEKARAEMARNPRYRWRGEVPGWAVRRAFAGTRLMVLSSKMEGGANVISEAVVAGVPVIASRIPGSVGLLGADYPGYYPVGDTRALARVLRRAEEDAAFLKSLAKACKARAPLFAPKRERDGWAKLLKSL
jgi:putative glycosyltransferase (TIGR04348 family)